MLTVLFFLIGLILGGCFAFVVLCCMQINRINSYEDEIRKLRGELNNNKD